MSEAPVGDTAFGETDSWSAPLDVRDASTSCFGDTAFGETDGWSAPLSEWARDVPTPEIVLQMLCGSSCSNLTLSTYIDTLVCASEFL